MPILDDRGRLFGKVNLIDAAVVLVVLALVPLGYASWMLFKTPLPTIQTATPSVVPAGQQDQPIQLTGQYLRPFLRVGVGTTLTTYLFESPDRAEVRLPALRPGSYDLVLFDETMEVGRKPNAITVVAKLRPVVTSVTPGTLEFTHEPQRVVLKGERLTGSFKAAIGPFAASYTSESPDRAELMAPPMAPGTFDLILSDGVQELIRVPKAIAVPKPAIDSITPHVVEFSLDSQSVALKGKHFQRSIRIFVGWKEVTPQFLSLERGDFQLPPFPIGSYDLSIFDPSGGTEYVRYAKAITIRPAVVVELKLRVRFVVRPEVLALVKQAQSEASPPGAARLLSYQVGEELLGTSKAELREGKVIIVDGIVRVPAIRKPDGWQFEGQSLKAGAPFVLKTQNYRLDGEILSLETSSARAK